MRRSLDKFSFGRSDPLVIAVWVLLIFSVLFGGASREHVLRLALVELSALPVAVIAGRRLIQNQDWARHRLLLGMMLALIAIPLFQLIPLPPMIWTHLPGRENMVLALELAQVEPSWTSLSLTPDRTWQSALALLPPVAMLLSILAAPHLAIRLVQLYLGAALLSMLLGGAQLAAGDRAVYVWATTSAGSVSGFFANRNHLATFVLALLPFAILLGAGAVRRREQGTLPIWLAACFTGLAVVVVAAIRSRAGILIFPPIVALAIFAAWFAAGRQRPKRAFLLLAGTLSLAITAVVATTLPALLSRFGESVSIGRFDRWPIVAQAAQTYLPFGSGLGSFDPVYRSVEPLGMLDNTFFNQAHNDYLEIWLETGWLGPALLAVFLFWAGRRSLSAWRSPLSTGRDLAQASMLGLAAILVHSMGDYPLRTVTITTLAALCCACLEIGGGANSKQQLRQRGRL
ncbi:O-antigen ligase family protein [Brevundimonas sp. FT23042]|uniref:O-antigen ligase family protein n=1 Tax=Brevundimonas sp. FT23042 TaxID=3393749 RepID=UPI003B58B28D